MVTRWMNELRHFLVNHKKILSLITKLNSRVEINEGFLCLGLGASYEPMTLYKEEKSLIYAKLIKLTKEINRKRFMKTYAIDEQEHRLIHRSI